MREKQHIGVPGKLSLSHTKTGVQLAHPPKTNFPLRSTPKEVFVGFLCSTSQPTFPNTEDPFLSYIDAEVY